MLSSLGQCQTASVCYLKVTERSKHVKLIIAVSGMEGWFSIPQRAHLILKHDSSKTSINIPFDGSLDVHRVSIAIVSITNHWDRHSFID